MSWVLLTYFLENSFIPMYGITLLFALWRYPKYFDTPLKYFPVFLLYTFLNEFLGRLIAKYDEYSIVLSELYRNNNWLIFNIYNIVFFTYFYYVYWSYSTNKNYRQVIYYGGVVFLLTSFVNPFFQNFLTTSQLYSYIVGAIVMIISIVLYLTEYIRNYTFRSIKSDLLFWISIGLLLFNTCYTPIKILRYHNALNNLSDLPIIRKTHIILILITYFLFIVGFVKMQSGLPKWPKKDEEGKSGPKL